MVIYSLYPPPQDAPRKPVYRLNLRDLPAPILYRIMAEHLGFGDVHCLSMVYTFLAHVCGLLKHTRIVQSPSALRLLVNRLATSTVEQRRARAVRSPLWRWDRHVVRSSPALCPAMPSLPFPAPRFPAPAPAPSPVLFLFFPVILVIHLSRANASCAADNIGQRYSTEVASDFATLGLRAAASGGQQSRVQ